MPSYKLVTYQSEKGPRAGVIVGDKLFDAAALTRKAAYATMLDILNDWQSAKGVLRKAAAAAGKSKLKSRPAAKAKLLAAAKIARRQFVGDGVAGDVIQSFFERHILGLAADHGAEFGFPIDRFRGCRQFHGCALPGHGA